MNEEWKVVNLLHPYISGFSRLNTPNSLVHSSRTPSTAPAGASATVAPGPADAKTETESLRLAHTPCFNDHAFPNCMHAPGCCILSPPLPTHVSLHGCCMVSGALRCSSVLGRMTGFLSRRDGRVGLDNQRGVLAWERKAAAWTLLDYSLCELAPTKQYLCNRLRPL